MLRNMLKAAAQVVQGVMSTEDIEQRKTVHAVPVHSIVIDAVTADVEFSLQEDTEDATVSLTGCVPEGQARDISLQVDVSDEGVLHIQVKHEKTRVMFGLQTLTLAVALPKQTYEMLRVRLTTGDVRISDLVDLRGVDVRVTTGDIDIVGNVGAQLRINTTTGDVAVSGSYGASDVSTVTGDVSWAGVIEDVLRVRVVTGDVTVLAQDLRNDLDVTTVTGDVNIRIHAMPSDVSMDLHTVTGNVVAHMDGLSQTGGKRKLYASRGTGGPTVSARCTTGDVYVSA